MDVRRWQNPGDVPARHAPGDLMLDFRLGILRFGSLSTGR